MNPSPAQPSAQSPLTATPTPPRIASPQFAVPQMRAFRPRPSRAPPPAPINGPRGLWRVGGYTVQKHEINMRSSPITRTCLRQSLNHALDVRNPSLHHLPWSASASHERRHVSLTDSNDHACPSEGDTEHALKPPSLKGVYVCMPTRNRLNL